MSTLTFERKYSDELRAKAVERVLERRRNEPGNKSILGEVAHELSIGEQSLRGWVNKAEGKVPKKRISAAAEPDRASLEEITHLRARIEHLEAELERSNEDNTTLRRASALFAAELIKK